MMNLGYNYGMAKLYAKMVGWEEISRFKLGVMAVEGLNTIGVLDGGTLAGRRASHFCGGAGLVYPRNDELKYVTRLQAWDSMRERDGEVLPAESDMELFEAATKHLCESEYKAGIRFHLIADNELRKFLMERFDFSNQGSVIIHKDSGIRFTTDKFKKELESFYKKLDQYCLNRAGVCMEEIERFKELLYATCPLGIARLLDTKLIFDPDFKWEDTAFFKLSDVSKLVGECNNTVLFYATNKFVDRK